MKCPTYWSPITWHEGLPNHFRTKRRVTRNKQIDLVNKMSQISTTSISPAPPPGYSTHPVTSEKPSQNLARIKTGDYLPYDLHTNSFQYSAGYYSRILSSSGRLHDPVLPVPTPADFMYPLPNNPKGLLKILEIPARESYAKNVRRLTLTNYFTTVAIKLGRKTSRSQKTTRNQQLVPYGCLARFLPPLQVSYIKRKVPTKGCQRLWR